MSATASSSSARRATRLRLPAWWSWGDAVAILIATLVVSAPALVTKNGFSYDFTNHLWLVYVQENAISHHLLPTYFVNTPTDGVDYPVFMFYGGTLYAAAGAIAALLGGAVVVAYVAVIMVSVAAAYGGLLWLARQLGARSWQAHAPAITYVTSAYYVTNLYGRGAWPEFVAVSALPLLAASGWRLARSSRIELLPAMLFVLAGVFFTGSHNITLLLGALFLALLLVALRLVLGRGFSLAWRRALALAGLFGLALGVNAWFLLPDVLHAAGTQAGTINYTWAVGALFNSPGVVLDPLRTVPSQSTTPGLFVQAPDWFLAWGVAAAAVLWPVAARRLRRAWLVLAALLAVVLTLILSSGAWNALPKMLRDMQFAYRLNTYVALSVAGLVLICVLAAQSVGQGRRRTGLWIGLAAATAVSIALCAWQLTVPNVDESASYRNRDGVFASVHATPQTWYDPNSYADASGPLIPTHGRVVVDPADIGADRVSLTIDPPAGTKPFAFDLEPGPYAVSVGGGVIRVGRAAGDETALARRRPGSGPLQLTLAPAGGSVTIGRWLTLLSVAMMLALLGFDVGRRLGKR